MDWVDYCNRLSLAIDPHVVIETTHLEEVQSAILTDYDHIFVLIHPGHIYVVVEATRLEECKSIILIDYYNISDRV